MLWTPVWAVTANHFACTEYKPAFMYLYLDADVSTLREDRRGRRCKAQYHKYERKRQRFGILGSNKGLTLKP